jgi:hypothetical protein
VKTANRKPQPDLSPNEACAAAETLRNEIGRNAYVSVRLNLDRPISRTTGALELSVYPQGITKAIEPTNVVKLDCLRQPPALKVIDGDRIDEPNEAILRDQIGRLFGTDVLIGFPTINHALPADCERADDQPNGAA